MLHGESSGVGGSSCSGSGGGGSTAMTMILFVVLLTVAHRTVEAVVLMVALVAVCDM